FVERSGADKLKGSLAVRDLLTGEIRLLAKPDSSDESTYEGPDSLRFSPDGSSIACNWLRWRVGPKESDISYRFELRVVPVEGGALRVFSAVKANPTSRWPVPIGWTPDGLSIISIVSHAYDYKNPPEFGVVNLADGSLSTIKTAAGPRAGIHGPCLSPDG